MVIKAKGLIKGREYTVRYQRQHIYHNYDEQLFQLAFQQFCAEHEPFYAMAQDAVAVNAFLLEGFFDELTYYRCYGPQPKFPCKLGRIY